MPTKVDAAVPTLIEVTWSGAEGDVAHLAARAENGKVYGISVKARAIMPIVISLLAAGKAMPEQGQIVDSQALQAKGFQPLIRPDGTKALSIHLGGTLELVLNIPQPGLAALRAAIAEIEAIPTPTQKH